MNEFYEEANKKEKERDNLRKQCETLEDEIKILDAEIDILNIKDILTDFIKQISSEEFSNKIKQSIELAKTIGINVLTILIIRHKLSSNLCEIRIIDNLDRQLASSNLINDDIVYSNAELIEYDAQLYKCIKTNILHIADILNLQWKVRKQNKYDIILK